MSELLFDILIAVMWGLIVSFSIQFLVPREKRLPCTRFLLYLLCMITVLFLIDYLHETFRIISILVSIPLLIYIFFKTNIIKSFIISIEYLVIESIGDIASLYLFLNIFHWNYSIAKKDIAVRFFAYLVIAVFCFLLIFIKGLIFKKIVQKDLLAKLEQKIMGIVKERGFFLLLFIFLLNINCVAFYETWNDRKLNEHSKIDFAYTYTVVILSCITIIEYYLYRGINLKSEGLKQKEKENEELKLYITIIEELSNDLQKHKHDYNNILMAERGYLENNDIDGLKQYFYNELMQDQYSLNRNGDIYLQLMNIADPALKGLVTSKLNIAFSLSLKISLTIQEKVENILVRNIDMVRIMGILLDNAIEAASCSDEKKLSVALINEGDKMSYLVENTFDSLPDIKNIYKKEFSTKCKGRGLGLNILQDILRNEYPAVQLKTAIRDASFIQELVIPFLNVETRQDTLTTLF